MPARTALKLSPPKGSARRWSRRRRAFPRTCHFRRRRRSGRTGCGPGWTPARTGSGSARASTSPANPPRRPRRKRAPTSPGLRAMAPIRIAIIGFGKIAADQHVPSISGDPRFELAATSSRSGRASRRPSPTGASCCDRSKGSRRSRSPRRPAALRDRPRMRPRRPPLPARKAADEDARRDRRPRRPRRGAGVSLFTTWHAQHHARSTPLPRRSPASDRGDRDPLARGRPQMASGPAVDLGAGRLRGVRPRHQRLLDRDENLPRRAVRAIRGPQLSRKRANPDRRGNRPSQAGSRRAADGSLDWRRSEGEEWTITVATTDGSRSASTPAARTAPRRRAVATTRPGRISGHLPHFPRPDRRAQKPRRCRAAAAGRRLPAPRATDDRRSGH